MLTWFRDTLGTEELIMVLDDHEAGVMHRKLALQLDPGHVWNRSTLGWARVWSPCTAGQIFERGASCDGVVLCEEAHSELLYGTAAVMTTVLQCTLYFQWWVFVAKLA